MPLTRAEIQRLVELEAALQGVAPSIALAVAQQESGFDPAARSPKGAMGVMQLMPRTAKDLGVDPTDVGDNIAGGVKYLAQLSQRYEGDRERTLAAYNAGPGMVDQYKGVPPFKETRGYVAKIMGMLGPASAEASPVSSGASMGRLQELEAELARREQQATPVSTPDEAASTIAQMRQRQAEPPSDLTVDIEKASPPLPAGRRPSRPWWDTMAEGMEAATPGRSPIEPTSEQWTAMTAEEDAAQRAQMAEQAKKDALTLGTGAISGGAGMAGRAVGNLVAPYAAPVIGGAARVVPPLMEVAGSYGARQAMVATGMEEPGTPGDIASAAVPLASSAIGGALKRAIPTLPGANPTMHTMAQETLEQLPGRLAPVGASAPLYQAANASNAAIPAVALWRTAGKVLKREQGFGATTRNTQAAGVARELLDLSKQHGGQVPLQRLDDYRQRVSRMAREASGAGSKEAPELRQLHSAIMDDLERAGQQGIPGGKELVQAIRADRKEHAVTELADLWSEGKGIQFIGGDMVNVNGKQIQNGFLKKLESDPHFAKSWTPAEVADIKKTLADVARLSRKPASVQSSAVGEGMKWAARVGGVGTGGVAGVGVALAGETVPRLIAAAMQSPSGREALRLSLREGRGRLTNAGLRGIAAAVAADALPADPVAP